MTKSAISFDGRVCEYCGLTSAVSHATARECIDGLQLEANRLKDRVRRGKPDHMGMRDMASAFVPRPLAAVRR